MLHLVVEDSTNMLTGYIIISCFVTIKNCTLYNTYNQSEEDIYLLFLLCFADMVALLFDIVTTCNLLLFFLKILLLSYIKLLLMLLSYNI